MLNATPSATSQTPDDRENRLQALLLQLRSDSETVLRQMAERLVDLPEHQSFGQIEYDLRDLAHQLAATAHHSGLEAGKKKATSGPAPSAPTAAPTPTLSSTATRPG